MVSARADRRARPLDPGAVLQRMRPLRINLPQIGGLLLVGIQFIHTADQAICALPRGMLEI